METILARCLHCYGIFIIMTHVIFFQIRMIDRRFCALLFTLKVVDEVVMTKAPSHTLASPIRFPTTSLPSTPLFQHTLLFVTYSNIIILQKV